MFKSGFLSPQLIAVFLGGGLAGAIFTWFVNLPAPTVITYNITMTAMEESAVTSIIPNLKIQVGNERIKAIYVHVIEFAAQSGPYLDRLDVEIAFPDKVRTFGKVVNAPSDLHHIVCQDANNGIVCAISPMTLQPATSETYKVIVAAAGKRGPKITTVNKNVELVEANEFRSRRTLPFLSSLSVSTLLSFTLTAVTIAIYLIVFPLFFSQRTRKVHPALADVIRTLAHLEEKLPFVSVKYLRQKVFASGPDLQRNFQFAIDSGILKTYAVENPSNRAHPTTACKLNRDHPLVKLVL